MPGGRQPFATRISATSLGSSTLPHVQWPWAAHHDRTILESLVYPIPSRKSLFSLCCCGFRKGFRSPTQPPVGYSPWLDASSQRQMVPHLCVFLRNHRCGGKGRTLPGTWPTFTKAVVLEAWAPPRLVPGVFWLSLSLGYGCLPLGWNRGLEMSPLRRTPPRLTAAWGEVNVSLSFFNDM
ncbi:hypothetical protein CDEST_08152 [Colletotrichum destructivum]|uniref:Uncharacterized protein n=1 Tax=Colletotrichum destructivum TaxID=34406 RepID=A0AAX4IK90_9PEZI|nr:hypothetical protein CDEST_08152 [Colletotrichum destructivum]